MNGADRLCDVLLANEINVCFANPGTSEMHFVAALDRKPAMRCILGLAEGVVTGAADGWARMTDRPAATLLHLGPGLANGLANLHNARRAHTPMLNIVGEHASDHLQYDAPLTSDIESLARPMSAWVGRVGGAADVQPRTEAGILAAHANRNVSTLILPADAAWGDLDPGMPAPAPLAIPARQPAAATVVADAAAAIRSGTRVALILMEHALRAEPLQAAGRIAARTGATLFSQYQARSVRGLGLPNPPRLPSKTALAGRILGDFDVAICIGHAPPVGFFGYPGQPGHPFPPGCRVIELGAATEDLGATLAMLAEELGCGAASSADTAPLRQADIGMPTGQLSGESISLIVARSLPEAAIICEESISSPGRLADLAGGLPRHDYLALTGGAIGIGIPMALGAAAACPDRKVINLQADGSGMYTVQGLWTQAREQLDVLTVIYSNRSYAVLQGEMKGVGVTEFGQNARRMLTLDGPALDWCGMARAMGVEAGRATTVAEFAQLYAAGLRQRGPFLIEAIID